MLKDLIIKSRSYRRFDNTYKITTNELTDLIELARLCPSARNEQPLRYILINEPLVCEQVFPSLAWAGYLQYWRGPLPEERPSAYIIMLKDNLVNQNHYCDDGIALQTIMLGATEKGLGGCIIGAFNKIGITRLFNLPQHLVPLYVLALGKPVENVVIEDFNGDVRYWRDKKEVHHVPKRMLDELILGVNQVTDPLE